MLCGEEGPPGPEVAVPRVGDGGGAGEMPFARAGLGAPGRGLCPAVLCQQDEEGSESSAG